MNVSDAATLSLFSVEVVFFFLKFDILDVVLVLFDVSARTALGWGSVEGDAVVFRAIVFTVPVALLDSATQIIWNAFAVEIPVHAFAVARLDTLVGNEPAEHLLVLVFRAFAFEDESKIVYESCKPAG